MNQKSVNALWWRCINLLVVLALLTTSGVTGLRASAQDLAATPHMVVFPEWEFFDGLDWPDGATVSISVADKPVCSVEKESWGGFFNGNFGDGCDLVIGDEVTFSDGTTTQKHIVQNLSVTQADAATDVVAGTADEGAVVSVWPHETGLPETVTVGADGSWSIDFTSTFDLAVGTEGRAQINDENGNATAVDWRVPKPWLIAFPENDAVEAWEFPAGDEVTLTIAGAAGKEWKGTAEVTTWGDPRTYYRFDFASDYDLKIGDTVTLTSTNVPSSISHIVQSLAVTGMDSAANTISGMADAGVQVDVWVHGQDEFAVHPLADINGYWTADFDDTSFDLKDGMCGRANTADANGLNTAVDWCLPYLDFRDDFNGSFGDGWYWVHENPAQHMFTDPPGFLRIYPTPHETGRENLLLRAVGPVDFAIETHVIFEPDTNFQFAGLLIYQDDGNFLQFGRGFCDIEGACVGNGIYFDYVVDGGFPNYNFATGVDNFDDAFLRLEKRGQMVRALFSYEGTTWFEIGTHWLAPEFQINGVGIAATPSFDYQGESAVADFDYFEMSQGHGFLPEGYHDGEQGVMPRWRCAASGWAVDPDNRDTDVNVEINVDGVKVEEFLPAGQYRSDLDELNLCVDGTCGFVTDLWDRIESYTPHQVTAYAQDTDTGEWVRLYNTPKELDCRTYDIYTFDLETGETKQITNLREWDEYNPHFSPNGNLVVHHTVRDDWSYALYVTDLKTGISTALNGGESGGWASFSPNGRFITFTVDNSLYQTLSPGIAAPRLIRADANMADWAPNGKRIVFQQPSDGSIRTMPVDRGKGSETIVAYIDGVTLYNPDWSPDGKWIAYDDGFTIYKIAVTGQGVPIGAPIALTNDPLWKGHPTWSPEGDTIVFHAGMNAGDYDLWSVPAAGGEPTWLTGVPGQGDYDPGYLFDSEGIGYASLSPDGQAPRPWVAAFTYDLPGNFWSEGWHSYNFSISTGQTTPEYSVEVSTVHPPYEGVPLLRPGGPIGNVYGGCTSISAIDPTEPSRFMVGWTSEGTYSEALTSYAGMNAQVAWDSGTPVDMVQHLVLPNYDSSFWGDYVCSFTAAP